MLGVDVNSEYIQILEVCLKKQRFYIQNLAQQLLPTGTVVHQRIVQPETFKQSLALLVKAGMPRFHSCAAALPVNQILHKTLPIMPTLSTGELEAHLQREVVAALPAKTDIAWDYCYVAGKDEISVTIAQQESVTAYVDIFNACGVNLKVIDVESYALARAWRVCYPECVNEECLYALVLLRAQAITVVFIYKQYVITTRSVPSLAQIVSLLPLDVGLPPLKQVWLVDETAPVIDVSILENSLQVPVKTVEFNDYIYSSQQDASKLFLNVGIALWGKC